MKVCPVCRSSHSDAFDHCPHDRAELGRYDLRADLHARRIHPSRSDISFRLFSSEPLAMRLRKELLVAGAELRRDPRGFIRNLLPTDIDPGYRHSLAISGAIVVTGLSTLFAITVLIVGLLVPASAIERDEVGSKREGTEPIYEVIPFISTPSRSARIGTHRSAPSGGSLPMPQRSAGGGGGGQKMETPPERGTTAQAALQQPVIPPSPIQPTVQNPALVVPATVYADPRSLPEVTFDVGDPGGKEATRSAGPGENAGIGKGRSGGIGPGDNSGFGSGRFGGTGGNGFQPGGGDRRGNGADDEIPWSDSKLSPTIIYKEKARYTEQARQRQIQGTVILRATFSADGRITDIRVIRGLPEGLTESAILAAQRIRFQPALRNGQPVTVHASLEFNFALY
jgi:TonB family protein